MRGLAGPAALGLAVLVAACASDAPPTELARSYLSLGDVNQAYLALDEAVAAHPEDQALRARLQHMRALYHLNLGQERVFADDDWGGIEEFERVLLIEPENVVAQDWKGKALGKLAEREVLAGDGARARGKLDEAMKHYEKALAYVPEYPGAVVGSKLVGDVFSARRVKSQDSYLKGMRAQASGQYDQTQYHMQIAIENDPSMASARERSDLARRQLADSRLRRARDAEERGWFETALREYKAVLAEFPSLAPDLDSRVAATQREVEAGAMLSDGILLIQRRDFTKARTKLEQAYEKSVAQRAAISAQLIALRETDLDRRYNIAFDLELDYRYDDALAAYRAVDKEWPGQLDVRTRIANLESSLELAKEAKVRGDAAETAGDLPGAIAAFREALTYAPKFGDLEKRIQALRARLDPPKDPAKSDPSPARQPTQ